MRLSTTAIASGLTFRDAPLAGAALLALLLVAAMLHQDMRTAQRERPAAPPVEATEAGDAEPVEATNEAPAALEQVVLDPPPAIEAPTATGAVVPDSEPLPAPEPAPLQDPQPRVAPEVERMAPPIIAQPPAPRPMRAAPTTVALRPGGAIEQRGRVLLQLLESGSGPNVVIAWPAAEAAQERLAATLARCHGMELALLRPDNTVLRADDPPGLAQPLDFDRWSRFPRAPSGVVTAHERAIEVELRRHHRGASGLFDSRPIRLFPRSVDAALLGGLETLLGGDYAGAKEINLTYEQAGGDVRLVGLRRDGVAVPGALTLPRVGTCPG